jgi:hypothetical protein
MRIGSPGKILKYYYESRLDSFALKFSVEKHLRESNNLGNFNFARAQLFYLPFYRFKGMSYSLISEQKIEDESPDIDQPFIPMRTVFHQRCRHFDLTIPAFENKTFGLDSLGVRPEVMPLNVFAKDEIPPNSALIEIEKTENDARTIAMGMFAFNLGFALEGKEHLISEMIREGLSIIYYPVWASHAEMSNMRCTFFIDGLSKRVINEVAEDLEYASAGKGNSPADEFKPVAHRCPNCGIDLPVSELSLVYYCANCHKSCLVNGDNYCIIQTRSAVYEQGKGHYPFWRFAFIGGKGEKTVGDFARILTGEIPLIAKDKARNVFYLYIPAFKTPDLDNLTSKAIRLNRTQPIVELTDQEISPGADMILPENEAIELARFYWKVMRSKYRYLNTPEYEFNRESIGQGELVWLTLAEVSPIHSAESRMRTVSA